MSSTFTGRATRILLGKIKSKLKNWKPSIVGSMTTRTKRCKKRRATALLNTLSFDVTGTHPIEKHELSMSPSLSLSLCGSIAQRVKPDETERSEERRVGKK